MSFIASSLCSKDRKARKIDKIIFISVTKIKITAPVQSKIEAQAGLETGSFNWRE